VIWFARIAIVSEQETSGSEREGKRVEYHKIETLYERDEVTHKLKQPLVLKNRTYGLLKTWVFTEKVDGTNIRCIYRAGKVTFGGKTDNAQIHADLIKWLYENVSPQKLQEAFPDVAPECETVIYGEGFGAGIQKGGGDYSPLKKLIVFDVLVTGLVYNKSCPIHQEKQSAIHRGLITGMGCASPAGLRTGNKEIQQPSGDSRLISGNTVSSTPVDLKSGQRSIGDDRETKSDIESCPEHGIFKTDSASTLHNMTTSPLFKEASAPFAGSHKKLSDVVVSLSPSPLTIATKPEESGDSCVPHATLESIKRNLIKDGWNPPRCICSETKWWLSHENVCDVASKLGHEYT
jgi:hypothetical protein